MLKQPEPKPVSYSLFHLEICIIALRTFFERLSVSYKWARMLVLFIATSSVFGTQTEEPGGLQSMGSLRVGHDFTFTFTFHFHALEKEMVTHSSVLAWRIPGTGEPGGLPSLGSHRVGHD